MSYYINLEKAVDYIENHLDKNLQLEEIAKAAGYSVPHFYRVFGAVVGCSVKEYIRRRRLSNAMYEVITTKRRITDIAFEHGFESHEVFTRTFKLAFGAPPSRFRKKQSETYLFERINLLSKLNESRIIILEPKIICKEEKLLVGIAREMNQSDNLKNALIENVKCEFRTKAKAIDNRINSELYYAAYDYVPADISKADNEINYIYYYCAEVADYEKIPTDMVKKTLPQAKYAVFHYDTANNTLNGEKLSQSVYDYIDGIWLPASGFELADTSDFEVMDEQETWVDYYISVK